MTNAPSPLPSPTVIGLGRMGANMARRMARGGLQVHGFDPSDAARAALAADTGVVLHDSLSKAVQAQAGRRLVWLMLPAGAITDQTLQALEDPTAMEKLAPVVADSGEGRWTVDEAIRQGTPVPVISAALMARFSSQGKADTSNRLLSLMRKGFGGHATVGKT